MTDKGKDFHEGQLVSTRTEPLDSGATRVTLQVHAQGEFAPGYQYVKFDFNVRVQDMLSVLVRQLCDALCVKFFEDVSNTGVVVKLDDEGKVCAIARAVPVYAGQAHPEPEKWFVVSEFRRLIHIADPSVGRG